jgi:hypothetical protein
MVVNADEPPNTGRSAEDPISEQDFSARLKQLQTRAEIVSSGLSRGMVDHSAFDQVLRGFLGWELQLDFHSAAGATSRKQRR